MFSVDSSALPPLFSHAWIGVDAEFENLIEFFFCGVVENWIGQKERSIQGRLSTNDVWRKSKSKVVPLKAVLLFHWCIDKSSGI